jgi:flagellar hook protein FlgE
MSLSSAMYTGVSGLLNNGQAMNVIGNNISNVNTVGYKEARTLFSDMLSANAGDNAQIGTGVQLQTVQNIYTQGTNASSENVTDLAIQGNTFFTLTDGAATPTTYLSRAGAFSVDNNYNLVNADGYKVLDSAGVAIVFPHTGLPANVATDFNKVTKIGTDGTISYLAADGTTTVQLAAKIGVSKVADTSSLVKMGGSLYKTAGFVTGTANGTSEQILSNTLEQSNVDMASEFVKMIVTQRAYSANSKTITTTDQMTQEVLGLIR